MAGSDDRKVFERNEVLWYPEGGWSTSTGDSQLDIDINGMNAAAASLQRSIEALDQRFKDLGFNPSSQAFQQIIHPLIGLSGESSILHQYSDRLRFIWKTSLNNSQPTNDELVNRIGLSASVASPLRMMLKGRPVILTQDTYVTEVNGGGNITVEYTDESGITGPTDRECWVFVAARENVVDGKLKLRAYFRLSNSDPSVFLDSDEILLFSLRWVLIKYDELFFKEQNVYTGGQTQEKYQFYIKDIRDYQHPERSHPQLFAPKGSVMLWRPHSFREFQHAFELTTTSTGFPASGVDKWFGRVGCYWEGWRVLDGHMGDYNMSNAFPMGWEAHTANPTNFGVSGQQEVQTDPETATVQVQSGSGNTVSLGGHTHPFDVTPKYSVFFYLIKN
ncbi:MAG: hypothetical protein HQM11_07615 [SAR324 cluster bacterium]|nr:hypothetical protein [SAR324 cluster bacterium]